MPPHDEPFSSPITLNASLAGVTLPMVQARSEPLVGVGRSEDDYTSPHRDRSVLITIDTQNDFTLSGAAAEIAGTMEVIPNIVRGLAAFEKLAGPSCTWSESTSPTGRTSMSPAEPLSKQERWWWSRRAPRVQNSCGISSRAKTRKTTRINCWLVNYSKSAPTSG